MTCHKVLLWFFLFATCLPQINSYKTSNNLHRRKRQDDRWSWGYVTLPQTTPKVIEKQALVEAPTDNPNTETETNEDDPCNRPLITRPDIAALGRRKSDTKCLEYIWNVRLRTEEAQRNWDCAQFVIKENKRKKTGSAFAIGGRAAYPGEFPHMAALGWKAAVGTWVFKCGGSLISEKFVLTAAHCTKASPVDTTIAELEPKIVRMGDRNIIDKFANGFWPNDKNISRIIVHPEYKSPKKYFDIALLELAGIVRFYAHLQPACLWSNFDTSSLGTEANVTGWGVLETGSRSISPILQVITINMVDSQTCDSLLRPNCNRNWCGIQDNQVCAGKLAGGVDACQGDSGGPLQVKINISKADSSMHYVIGITSFGFSCALPDTPGVYTRVSTFIDWIESVVWP